MNINLYWTKRSCENQLTIVINSWGKILGNKGQVVTIILGSKNAFDTDSHELLKNCSAMEYVVKWMDSFIRFRQHHVVVNRVKSFRLQFCRCTKCMFLILCNFHLL